MGYQNIYDRLRANGLTEAGSLGMLGNWDCESNCESVRVQGDFSPYRSMSKQYTEGVDNGSISKKQFMGDSKGYGLAQWTYWTRKAALYDFCKQRNGSIGSEDLQIQFAVAELVSDFQSLLKILRESNDLYQCTRLICYQFENPAVKNVDARYAAAVRIRGEIDLNPEPGPVPPEPPVPPSPAGVYWPPRTIDCHCVDWPEVTVLGAVLYCRGYLDYAADAWNSEVTEAVKDFQFDNGLTSDGVVGPKTWKMLLEVNG